MFKSQRILFKRIAELIKYGGKRMKRKRLLAAVMAAVMASTLTMGMPVTGYAMDQGTETVANEPEGSNSSDAAVTNPEQDAESVMTSTTESDVVSESQGKDPDVASVAESKEAKSGAMAAPDTQSNTVGAAEENGAASAGTVGAAETKTSGNFEYEVKDDGTVNITKYTGSDANVTIPKTIDGKTVSEIGQDPGIYKGAFEDYKKLQRLTIPDGVTSIGEGAFAGCTSLQQITIPDSVTSIGDYAFGGCKALQQITIPDSVTSIGKDAFDGCTSLQQITIPDGVTSIGEGAFAGCTSLQQITIPDSVTSIGRFAFDGCSSLQQITLPNGVTSIGDDAFYGCESLQQITIPDGVTSIGNYAFGDCEALTQITIPDSVTSIGMEAFYCTSLKKIYFYGDAPTYVTNADIPSDATIYVLKGKSGWKVPTWNGYKTAYFTPENKPASTPTPVPTATPTIKRLDFSKEVFSFHNITHKRSQFGCLDTLNEKDYDELFSRAKPSTRNFLGLYLSGNGYGGHCYGMSSAVILNKAGRIDFLKDVGSGAKNIHKVSQKEATSRLCFYQALAILDKPTSIRQAFAGYSEPQKLNEMVSAADKAHNDGLPFLLEYQVKSEKKHFAHAVVAYDIEHDKFTLSGNKSFDGKILVYDCNEDGNFSEKSCVYYNQGHSEIYVPYWNEAGNSVYIQAVSQNLDYIDARDDSSDNLTKEVVLPGNSSFRLNAGAGDSSQNGCTVTNGKLIGDNSWHAYYDTNDNENSLDGFVHVIVPDGDNKEVEIRPDGGRTSAVVRDDDYSVVIDCKDANNAVVSPNGATKLSGVEGEFYISVAENSMEGSDHHTFAITGNGNREDVSVDINKSGVNVNGGENVVVKAYGDNKTAEIQSREMYRLYNPNSGEHFYTSNQGERDHLVSLGWRYEGVAWNAPLTGAPIFRLYNPNAGDHHYTGSEKERDDLVKLGWKYEGVAWYTAPSTTKKPQYRLYNPNCTGAGAHHYTGSIEERDGLVKLGWRYEGIAWYGV